MKRLSPIIGVVPNIDQEKYSIREEYLKAVLDAGGLPFILPLVTSSTDISEVFNNLHGLLLTGGDDVDPSYYGEEPHPTLGILSSKRDQSESMMVKEALSRNIPILAICRGMHMLNVAAGGTLYQDINTQIQAPVQHYQMAPRDVAIHSVHVTKGSLLYQCLGSESCRVNSIHHQSVCVPAPGFQVSATASDGVVEGIESTEHTFVVGVQWHPGSLTQKEAHARSLFHSYIKAATAYAATKL